MLARISATLLIAVAIVGCAAGSPQEFAPDEEATLVRVVSFAVGEGSEVAWSDACRRLATAAMKARTDANWLIHRIDDTHYYLVTFGDREDFQDPHSPVQGFARYDVGELEEEFTQLHEVKYTVTSDEMWEQVPAWSTTSDMNSLTHPGVDHRSYQVDSTHLDAVDSLLTDMANLLSREKYTYPMEGFRVGNGRDVAVHVVTFFGARNEYYSKGQPVAFLADRGKRQRWLRLLERLNAITHDRRRTESRYLHNLSYDPWLLEQARKSGG